MDLKISEVPILKISIIVPVYNVEIYLEKCLESCIGQSLSGIEIIVVDDGSTDSSSDIVDKYANQYPKLIRAFHKSNEGLGSARNYGLDIARGEYIAFVDSDDWIATTMLEEMYEKAIDLDCDVVVCGGLKVSSTKEKTKVIDMQGDIDDFNHSVAERPNILFASKSYACNKIYRRHLFHENKHRFPSKQWFEDSAVIYNVLLDANRVACIPKFFYYYRRMREGAITSSVSPKIFDIFKSCDSILSYYNIKKINHPDIRNIVEKIICSHLFVRFKLLFLGANKPLAREYIAQTFVYLDVHFPGWRKRYHPLNLKGPTWLFRSRKNRLIAYAYLYCPNWVLYILHEVVALILNTRKRLFDKYYKWVLKRKGLFLIDALHKAFDNIPAVWFVDFGTLLGFVRDNDFISNDKDIDIGVIATEEQKSIISKTFEDKGFRLWRAYKLNKRIVEESYHYLSKTGQVKIKFDINYYENNTEHSRTWLFYQKPGVQYPPGVRSVVEMVYSRINGVKHIQIKGHHIPIPKNAERLLEEKYGPNWRIPDPEWIYWESPAAVKLDELGTF